MKKRLFAYTTLILLAGLLCFFAASLYVTYQNNLQIAKDEVEETARIYAGLYRGDADPAAFVRAGEGVRITLISPEGDVLADSLLPDVGGMDNHLGRPEIQAAAKGTPRACVRHSDTLGAAYIYYALQVESDDSFVYVRTAVPVAAMDAYLRQTLPPLVLVLLAVSLLCFLLSRGMIRRIIKPFASVEHKLRLLAGGAYTQEPVAGSYGEIDALVMEIDEVAQALQGSLADLREEKTKLDYLMRNMGDGLFVLDDSADISLINTAAMDIFRVSPAVAGKNLRALTNQKPLVETAEECVCRGKDSFLETVINGRIFLVTVKRLPETKLTMAVLSDVTENRENAKRREEFFANASHELKTPLTAIKGFNELISIHNKDDGIRKYIESVARETDRMLSLIGDMLRLSELENQRDIRPVPVSLAKTAGEACEALAAAIREKSVSVEIAGDGVAEAEPGHVYELVKNLLENAVRYNNPGGRVLVTIQSGAAGTRLIVCDDGVGIAPEEQARVFERFYRVEKSRSQQNGGTGLGLSIVKHICALYGWKISLSSKPGAGTTVTVAFSDAADRPEIL